MSSSPRLDPAFNDDEDLSFTSPARTPRRSRRSRATSSGASSQASTSAQAMGGSLGDELNFGDSVGGGGTLGDELGGLGESLGDELGGAGGGGGALGDELGAANAEEEAAGEGQSDEEQEDDDEDLDAQSSTAEAYHARAAASMQDSVAATTAFLQSLRSLSSKPSNTLTPSASATSQAQRSTVAGEDTAGLESIAGSIVRQLRAATAERESQVRELREITRELGREDIMRALAATAADEAAELPEWDEAYARDGLGIGPSGGAGVAQPAATKPRALNGIQEQHSDDEEEMDESHRHHGHEASEEDGDAYAASSARVAKPIVPVPPPNAPASEQLVHLRFCTTELLTSLSTLSEHSQVSRAATSDAARRLRALRGVLSGWKAEQEGVAASRAWIQAAEADEPQSATRDVKAWTGAQMERAERALAEASAKAKELLQPPRCDAMDRLVGELPEGALDNVPTLARETAQQSAVQAGA